MPSTQEFKRWLSMLRRSSEGNPSSGDLLSYVSNNQVQWIDPATVAADHGGLAGLTDDDHTQYLLLAGRTNGQSANGGIDALDDLTLVSTAHGTKGSIFLGSTPVITVDEQNNRFEWTEGTQDKCRVNKAAAFTHNSSGNFLSIPFDQDTFDPNAMHDVSSNTERITIQNAGFYLIGGHVDWTSDGTGQRIVSILHSTAAPVTTEIARNRSITTMGVGQVSMPVVSFYQAAATDWFELQVWQNSGGNLDVIQSADISPEFWAVKIA